MWLCVGGRATLGKLILVAGLGGSREAICHHPEIKCSQIGFLKTNGLICNFQVIIIFELKEQYQILFSELILLGLDILHLTRSLPSCAPALTWEISYRRFQRSREIYTEDNTVNTDLAANVVDNCTR